MKAEDMKVLGPLMPTVSITRPISIRWCYRRRAAAVAPPPTARIEHGCGAVWHDRRSAPIVPTGARAGGDRPARHAPHRQRSAAPTRRDPGRRNPTSTSPDALGVEHRAQFFQSSARRDLVSMM
jgi:hypothetical protein